MRVGLNGGCVWKRKEGEKAEGRVMGRWRPSLGRCSHKPRTTSCWG